jgi:hypothetical protein
MADGRDSIRKEKEDGSEIEPVEYDTNDMILREDSPLDGNGNPSILSISADKTPINCDGMISSCPS